MVLVFNNLSYEAILKFSENPTPEEQLYGMTFGELEVLTDRIDKIAQVYENDETLFARLMRLKSHTTIVEESAKKRDEEFR